ncbi:hypothetical protein EYF80_013199 [Liparis tanakae]|uniref:Uncharacterized protein n=1 Tax=Liparis tanakae TaxID=230148 RepID=A0A4Z2IEK8_9TELE|nr:hypothetical protein EYF80_013199 [Liparis tanakae]
MVMGIAMLRMCVPASVQMRNSSGFHFFCLALTLRMLQVLARMDRPEQTSQASVLALMTSSFMVVTSSTMLEWSRAEPRGPQGTVSKSRYTRGEGGGGDGQEGMQDVGQGRHPIWVGVHSPWERHSRERTWWRSVTD